VAPLGEVQAYAYRFGYVNCFIQLPERYSARLYEHELAHCQGESADRLPVAPWKGGR
jgi:hypothetical protein